MWANIRLRRALAAAKLGEVKIDGDSASSTMTFLPPGDEKEAEEVPILFKRVDGRWYVHVPGPEEYDDLPFRPLIGGGVLP